MRINAAGLALVLGLAGPGAAVAVRQPIGEFAANEGEVPAPWKVERFDAKVAATRYRTRTWDGVPAVEANAERSMAVLVRPVEVDLGVTPHLCWRWRIDATIAAADIRTKAGDDYAARVYLMFRVAGEHLGLTTRAKLALARSVRGDQVPDAALNYVWDNRSAVDTVVPNAYTDRAMMWVLRSGDADAKRWVGERRDIGADFRRAFGYPPAALYAIGLATDTDNTGGKATAGFAELKFVSADEACTP